MRFVSEYYGVQSLPLDGYLEHHGIKGQKWGIRRFQNPDGSLTPEGKQRYGRDAYKVPKKVIKKQIDAMVLHKANTNSQKVINMAAKEIRNSKEGKEYQDMQDVLNEVYKNAAAKGATHVQFGGEIAEVIKQTTNRYNRKVDEILKSHSDEYLSAMLKDLDYDDNEENRRYLRKLGYVDMR